MFWNHVMKYILVLLVLIDQSRWQQQSHTRTHKGFRNWVRRFHHHHHAPPSSSPPPSPPLSPPLTTILITTNNHHHCYFHHHCWATVIFIIDFIIIISSLYCCCINSLAIIIIIIITIIISIIIVFVVHVKVIVNNIDSISLSSWLSWTWTCQIPELYYDTICALICFLYLLVQHQMSSLISMCGDPQLHSLWYSLCSPAAARKFVEGGVTTVQGKQSFEMIVMGQFF